MFIKNQDTELVRVTFRLICQSGIILACIVGILYTALFLYYDFFLWWASATYAALCIPLYWATGLKRSFPVFMTGLLIFAIATILKLAFFSIELGRIFGFHFILIVFLPVIAISGRINVYIKAALILFMGSLLIWLDFRSSTGGVVQTELLFVISLFRVINLSILIIITTGITYYYFRLITQQQALLQRQASYDILTGILNRQRMTELAKNELIRFNRYKHPMTLLFCDLDYFKKINDTFGHEVGDAALCHASNIFTGCIRATDRLSRWGREEFLILLPDTDIQGAMIIARRMHEQFNSTPLIFNGSNTYFVTATIAVATAKADESFNDLLRRADNTLYRGKTKGRNRVLAYQQENYDEEQQQPEQFR